MMEFMSNAEFKLNHPWGSVQYDAAREWYDRYFAEKEQHFLTPEEIVKRLGFSMEIDKAIYDNDFEEKKRIVGSEHPIEEEDEGFWEEPSAATTTDDLFRLLRNDGWDLWGAAHFIANNVWGILITDQRVDGTREDKADGWPLINALIIGNESATTGLCCAVLKDMGIVNDESVFEDFST